MTAVDIVTMEEGASLLGQLSWLEA